MDLGQFLAGIRGAETGNVRGDYMYQGEMVNGYQGRGAYNISPRNWDVWSKEAGVSGADWRSPQAQDLVAATQVQKLYDRYGSWELAAAGWFGGPQSADSIAGRGFLGADSIENEEIKQFTKGVMDQSASQEATDFLGTYSLPKSMNKDSWLFPIAGPTEWSRGSWMPNTLTHRGRTHAAIDVYSKRGTPVVSPVSGTVLSAGFGDVGGNNVRIQGDDGNVYYLAHMDKTPTVEKGQKIQAGIHIGNVGNSGSASRTKPHVHFSVKRNGKAINPATLLEGATQGGGGFSMDLGAAEIPNQRQDSKNTMSSWIQSLSDAVAGGTRQDPRELAAWEEPVPQDVVDPQPGADVTPRTGGPQ